MRRDLIWDFFQNEAPGTFAGSRARLAYLANKVKHAGTVLNIGVGGGALEEVAIRQGLTVYSLDPSERSVAHMRERFGLMDRAQVGYSQDIPFPDRPALLSHRMGLVVAAAPLLSTRGEGGHADGGSTRLGGGVRAEGGGLRHSQSRGTGARCSFSARDRSGRVLKRWRPDWVSRFGLGRVADLWDALLEQVLAGKRA